MKLLISLLKRFVSMLTVLLVVIILNFLMLHLAPGDIADTIAATMGGADEKDMIQLRTEYGLDQPFFPATNEGFMTSCVAFYQDLIVFEKNFNPWITQMVAPAHYQFY